MRVVHWKVSCLLAALISVTSCSAIGLCDSSVPSLWKLARARGQKEHIVVRNVIKRACALHAGRLNRPPWEISIEGAISWEETALVMTAAATDAYSRDHPLQLSGDLPHAVSLTDDSCDINKGCLFGLETANFTASNDKQNSTDYKLDVWDSQRVLRHYLLGAGLLWLRSRSSDVSGCHLAGAFARLHLQPTGAFRGLVDSFVVEITDSRYEKVVVLNVDSVHCVQDEIRKVVNGDGSTGVLLTSRHQ